MSASFYVQMATVRLEVSEPCGISSMGGGDADDKLLSFPSLFSLKIVRVITMCS